MGTVELRRSQPDASSPQDSKMVLMTGATTTRDCQGCEWMEEMLGICRRIDSLVENATAVRHPRVREIGNEEWLAQ